MSDAESPTARHPDRGRPGGRHQERRERLVLFDIDGTLLSARSVPRRAFERAMIDVYGTAGPIDTHRFSGKTDPQIARELLTLAGLDDGAIDEGLDRLWRTYIAELRAGLADAQHRTLVHPGVRELLARLESRNGNVVLGLLTGNIREGAALKLDSARIDTEFRVGAFGCDCEQRDGLPAIAVERALALTGRAFHGRDVVVIGDTPNDVACGRSLDVLTVAVATGRYDEGALRDAGAHVVFRDLTDTDAVLGAVLRRG